MVVKEMLTTDVPPTFVQGPWRIVRGSIVCTESVSIIVIE